MKWYLPIYNFMKEKIRKIKKLYENIKIYIYQSIINIFFLLVLLNPLPFRYNRLNFFILFFIFGTIFSLFSGLSFYFYNIFLHYKHLQFELHFNPFTKQSQYPFKQLFFLHLQPFFSVLVDAFLT